MRELMLICTLLTGAGCPGDAPEIAAEDLGPRPERPAARDGQAAPEGGRPDAGGPADRGAGSPDRGAGASDLPPRPPDTAAPDRWVHDGSIGKPCAGWQDCAAPYICTTNTHTGHTYCTLPCNPCDPSPCPAGTGCQPAGQGYHICALGYADAPC